MKRHGNLWENVISFEALLRAAVQARKGKRYRPNVAAEDRPLLWNLVLGAAIQNTIDTERTKPLSAWRQARLDEAEALLRSIREDGLPEVPMEGPRPRGAERTLARLQAAHRLLKQ